MTDISRRSGLKLALGAVGAAASTPLLADTCGPKTGAQPLGPFFPNAGTPTKPIRENQDPNVPLHLANDNDLTNINGQSGVANGQQVYVRGVVRDAECQPIEGANIVIWQASASGKYNHNGDGDNTVFRHPITGALIRRQIDPNFQFWGRTTSDAEGEYVFKTIVPGFYPADLRGGWFRPPHIHMMVTARGYPQLVTQMYFDGEIEGMEFVRNLNGKDYLLQSRELTEAQRQQLVVNFAADPEGGFEGLAVGTFDLQLLDPRA